MQLSQLSREAAPVIRNIVWSPAAIVIQFPNGDKWEYVVYDNAVLRRLVHSYRLNVGRLVAKLREGGFEARRI